MTRHDDSAVFDWLVVCYGPLSAPNAPYLQDRHATQAVQHKSVTLSPSPPYRNIFVTSYTSSFPFCSLIRDGVVQGKTSSRAPNLRRDQASELVVGVRHFCRLSLASRFTLRGCRDPQSPGRRRWRARWTDKVQHQCRQAGDEAGRGGEGSSVEQSRIDGPNRKWNQAMRVAACRDGHCSGMC